MLKFKVLSDIMKDKIFLGLLIILMSLILIGFFGVIITIKINVSYQIEQLFWFLLGCSLVLFFYLYLSLIFPWYNQNRNTFKKIGFYWFWSFLIGFSLLTVAFIFYVYLKSFVPIITFDLIMELKNLLGIILYSFVWIGIILMIISIILLFFSPVKNENNVSPEIR